MGRFVATGQRTINRDFDLKKRKYIGGSTGTTSRLGPTSTCAELAFLMSNQVLSRPGAVMWDCFAGTGSLLIAATAHGSHCVGTDIDVLAPSVLLASIGNIVTWEFTGYNMLIFYSSLSTIPHSLYEAASIDGASEWQIVKSIKLPELRGSLAITVIFSIIGSFQLFNEPSILQNMVPGNAITTYYTPNMYAYNLSFSSTSRIMRPRWRS